MAAATPCLGTIKSGYEVAAIECGKGIFLVQLLANCINHLRSNKVFLAQQDLDACEIDLPRLKLRQGGDSLKHLVRFTVHGSKRSFTKVASLRSIWTLTVDAA